MWWPSPVEMTSLDERHDVMMTESPIFKRHSFSSWNRLVPEEEAKIFTSSLETNAGTRNSVYDVTSTEATEDDIIFARVTEQLNVFTRERIPPQLFFFVGLCIFEEIGGGD